MMYLPGRPACRKLNQPKKEMYDSVSKDGRVEISKFFDTTEVGIYTPEFMSCFGSVFSYYVPISLFWNSDIYN